MRRAVSEVGPGARRAEAVVCTRIMRGRARVGWAHPRYTEGYESAAQMAGPTLSGLS
jgi:hypothetical protein